MPTIKVKMTDPHLTLAPQPTLNRRNIYHPFWIAYKSYMNKIRQ